MRRSALLMLDRWKLYISLIVRSGFIGISPVLVISMLVIRTYDLHKYLRATRHTYLREFLTIKYRNIRNYQKKTFLFMWTEHHLFPKKKPMLEQRSWAANFTWPFAPLTSTHRVLPQKSNLTLGLSAFLRIGRKYGLRWDTAKLLLNYTFT